MTRSLRRLGRAPVVLLVFFGCTIQPTPGRTSSASQGTGGANSQVKTNPVHFDIGSSASAALIEAWDIDVRPDGRGLPAGSGSVAQGQALYRARCAHCHGATGREGPNDRLVGETFDDFPFGQSTQLRGQRTVGNYWPYSTTLFDYIRRAMPFDSPGTLDSDEIYGAVAFVLYLNDLIPEDAVMDAETLSDVVMPARDRFVVDDRTGGGVIR
jgi:S-disulfanyl-L-cysteine oxidoreductase SoxD